MKGKLGNKNLCICLLSFIMAMILTVICYYIKGIYPGSNRTILVYDQAYQYIGIWKSLSEIIKNPIDIFYNPSLCLGGNNWSLIGYYLGSPLNLIISFCSIEKLPLTVYIITVIKFGLISLSFSIYLLCGRKVNIKPLWVIGLSLCFALCSYNVMYAMSLMWLDAVILFPIVLLTVEKLLNENKKISFVIILSILFYVNYYIGYMISLFLIMYVIFRLIELNKDKKEFLNRLLSFAGCGIISAFIAMPILLPTVISISSGKGMESTGNMLKLNYDFVEFFKALTSCNYTSITANGTLSIFAGTVTLILAICFFFMKKVKNSTKIAAVAVIVIFFFSFWLRPLDTIWHCMKRPVCFPARYAFCFSFFLLYLSAESIECIYEKENDNEFKYKNIINHVLTPICMLITIVELVMNGSYIIGELNLESKYRSLSDYKEIVSLVEDVKTVCSTEDINVYRTDTDVTWGLNDPMLFGYRGIASFSSLYNFELFDFMKAMGTQQYNYIVSGNGSSPILRDFLGNRYYYSDNDAFIFGFSELGRTDKAVVYENENAYNPGIIIEDKERLSSFKLSEDIFENNNSLFETVSGIENCFIPLEVRTDIKETGNVEDYEYEATIDIDVVKDGPVYIICEGESKAEALNRQKKIGEVADTRIFHNISSDKATFYKGDLKIADINISYGQHLIYIGNFKKGDIAECEIIANYPMNKIKSAVMDTEKYEEGNKALESNKIEYISRPNRISAFKTNNDSAASVLLSIPFDSGIRVHVDGKKADYYKVMNVWTAIDIEAGEHEIEIKYVPPGFVVSLIFSLLGIILLGAWQIYGKKGQKGE